MPLLDDEVLPVSDLEPPARSALPRALGVAIVVLLLAGAVSAVTMRDGSPSARERFEAISAAVAEEPFAFEIVMSGTVAGVPQEVGLRMLGAVDPATKRTMASMDLSAVVPAGSGAPSTISVITEGTVAYVQVPTPGSNALQWTKIDGAALTQGATGGVPAGTNPLDSFDQLRAVSAEIENLGQEDVRGTTTTHYRTTLDPAKILETMPAERRAAAAAVMQGEIPVEVWLDDQDRPRRQRMSFTIPATGGSPGGSLTMTIEAFDFGKAVSIDLPPADQIVEAPSPLVQPPQ